MRCAATWTRGARARTWTPTPRGRSTSSPRPRPATPSISSREPDRVRERYGPKGEKYTYVGKTLDTVLEGEKFLLARRLVEAGVSVVTLRCGQWDHHGNVIQASNGVSIWHSLERCCRCWIARSTPWSPICTSAASSKEVLVLIWGEMGRTPKISQAGRDHWMDAGYALFAGAASSTGQVVGETDSRAERPKNRAVGPRTCSPPSTTLLGIDPAKTVPDFNGRPQYLLDDREPIQELVG